MRDHWGFTLLRRHWNALLHESAADNPFLTWEWLHTWWTELGAPGALHLLVVRDGDELIALAPLRETRGTFGFGQLEFLGTGYAGSDYLDVIIRTGRETDVIPAIVRHLQETRLALRLEHVRPGSATAQIWRQLADQGWTSSETPDGVCPIVPLEGQTWESYLASLGSSHRANVRRRLRALEQQFDVRFERVTADAERRDLLRRLAEFTAQRWKDHGGSTAFMTPSVLAFQDEASRRFLGGGTLRMYVLRLDGAPAAMMYGFLHGERFYFYQHGYDARYKAHSIGLALMAMTIRAAIDDGAREFDMLWGVEPYKFLWARETRELLRLDAFPVHLGGIIHRHTVQARRRLGTLARRVQSLGAHLWS